MVKNARLFHRSIPIKTTAKPRKNLGHDQMQGQSLKISQSKTVALKNIVEGTE